ncbi:MAG: DNA-protecting protein DprA [Acidobacteria bacterium]|nr:DNA-protecting protein DprA [Acidobacteriota bacterium]
MAWARVSAYRAATASLGRWLASVHSVDTQQLDDLTVALNASPLVSREANCRLSVTPEIWLDAPSTTLGELAHDLGVSTRSIRHARECARSAHHLAANERARARDVGGAIVTRHSPHYPVELLDLDLPPPVLYVLGHLPRRPAISIVGSRKADPYAIEVAEKFAGELAVAGLTVVSGLALGVDSAAHQGALAVGGQTVAVLGCGIDIDYPRGNRRLRARMAESGAIVTEFPIGTAPEPYHFPIRNRIIAALGCGTLVVRGTLRSGSLITAGCALTLGRLVWAIPGNIFDPRSMGPNSLIRDGAHPAQTSGELLETLPTAVQQQLEAASASAGALGNGAGEPLAAPGETAPNRSDLAKLFHSIPAGETADASALLETTALGLDEVLSLLVELEIMGFLTRYPGPVWGRSGSPPRPDRE